MQTLKTLNISFHIGYITFYKEVALEDLIVSIEYLYNLKKLYRLGILMEKMRNIPKSKSERDTTNGIFDIDIAYNYEFDDKRISTIFNILSLFFNKNFNIRNFENVCSVAIYKSYLFQKYHILNAVTKNMINQITESIEDLNEIIYLLLKYIV